MARKTRHEITGFGMDFWLAPWSADNFGPKQTTFFGQSPTRPMITTIQYKPEAFNRVTNALSRKDHVGVALGMVVYP